MTAVNYKLRRPQPSRKPEHVPAAIAMMADAKFADLPYGGFAGEFLSPSPEPPRPVVTVWQPPPPDWAAEEAERRERGEPDTPPPLKMTAHEQMMADAVARGEADWPVVPGPPISYGPLERFRPQPVDWRRETQRAEAENARAAREHAAKLLGLDEETPKPDYPAKRSLVQPVPKPAPGSLRFRIPPPPWKTEDGAA